MSYWKVKVDCIKLVKGIPETVKATIVLEADSTEKAIEAGLATAEKTAEFGPKWVAFEFRSASPLTLPLKLDQSMTKTGTIQRTAAQLHTDDP